MNHRYGRQRRDGSRPSGKSSGSRKSDGRTPNSQPKLFRNAIGTSHPGLDPRARTYVMISPLTNENAVTLDVYRSSPPIVLPRSRLAISAPTAPNVANATT